MVLCDRVALFLCVLACSAGISVQHEQGRWKGAAEPSDGEFCASSPCMNNGTCTEALRACRCPPMYFGETCEIHQTFLQPEGPCHNHPCLNQGQCDVATGACLCPQGFKGAHCEQKDWAHHVSQHGSKWKGIFSNNKVLSYWSLAVSSSAFVMVLGLAFAMVLLYKKVLSGSFYGSSFNRAPPPPPEPMIVPHYIVMPPEGQMGGAQAADKPPVYDNSPPPPIELEVTKAPAV